MNDYERIILENNKLRKELQIAKSDLAQCRAELETERMKLAACGLAAVGDYNGSIDKYDSISLHDVIKLRANYETLKQWRDELQSKRLD